MTKEELALKEEAEKKAKLAKEGEAKIKSLEEKLEKQAEAFKNMEKGIQKLAEKKNKEGKGDEGGEEGDDDKGGDEQKPVIPTLDPVTKSVYMQQNPELELVMDDVVEEAERLGVDPIQHYEQSKSWKIAAKEASRIAKEKAEEEGKIESPDGTTEKGKQKLTDLEKMEQEFEGNLPPGFENNEEK